MLCTCQEWDKYDHFFDYFTGIEEHVDYLYMADSFGAVLPDYIEKIVNELNPLHQLNWVTTGITILKWD